VDVLRSCRWERFEERGKQGGSFLKTQIDWELRATHLANIIAIQTPNDSSAFQMVESIAYPTHQHLNILVYGDEGGDGFPRLQQVCAKYRASLVTTKQMFFEKMKEMLIE
jgi:hypothetical protein